MKVCLLFTIRNGPWGGGNQFLSGLRDYLVSNNQYSDNVQEADIVLFDSFNDFNLAIHEKYRNPSVPFVHRINGPISAYRGKDLHVDYLIYSLARHLADAVIFQSSYSKRSNYDLGMDAIIHDSVIHNAARPLFTPPSERIGGQRKTKVVAASWSSNLNKGFDTLKYLDEKLDFSRYELTFIGRTPVSFTNVITVPPKPAESLVEYFRESHVLLAASRNDPCSNTVLEALATGLPIVAHNSGGMPEIVGNAGTLFEDNNDVITAIDTVSHNIDRFRQQIIHRSINDAAQEYVAFFQKVLDSSRIPKKLSYRGLAELSALIMYRKIRLGTDKLRQILAKGME